MNLSLALLATSFAAAAEAMTFSSLSAQELVKDYFNNPDDPVEFRNVEASDHSCFALLLDGHSAGRHSNSNNFLIPNDAILLSTGKPEDFHMNDSDETTTDLGITTGDAHLEHNMVQGTKVLDPCFIQFEFSCPDSADIYTPQVSFDYVFGSEEYLTPKKKKEDGEDVRGRHSDKLGFFLNGQNIAQVPDENGGMVSVSIEHVNEKRNTQNFVSNKFIVDSTSVYSEVEADGFTTKLTAQGEAKPGWNIVKIAIADVGDATLDSWVLLEAGSFSCALGEAPKSLTDEPEETEPEPVQAEEPIVAAEVESPKTISAVGIFFLVLFGLILVVWGLLAAGALRVNLKNSETKGKTITVALGEPDVTQMKARSIEMYGTIKEKSIETYGKVKAKSKEKFGSKKVTAVEEDEAASTEPAEKKVDEIDEYL